MLTATVLMLLHASPAFLTDGMPRSVRLVADEVPPPNYETMSREELQIAYDLIEARRPGIWLPTLAGFGGGLLTVTTLIALFGGMASTFGIAVYVAVILTAAAIVGLGLVALGIVIYVRNRPAREAARLEMEKIEAVYREGRCRNERDQRPCPNDPNRPQRRDPGPLMAPPEGGGIIPQVMAPATMPSLVLASF